MDKVGRIDGKIVRVPAEVGTKMVQVTGEISSMMDYMSGRMDVQSSEMRRQANKALYDLAEKTGRNLWDLCFQVMPHWEETKSGLAVGPRGMDLTFNAEYQLELIPMRVDWEHGEGYWEKKYKELKEQLRQLIGDDDAE